MSGLNESGQLTAETVTDSDRLYVDSITAQAASTAGQQTVSGTVTDQYGEPVADMTVQATGVATPALDESAGDLEGQADDLLDELSNPLPDGFDRDLDPRETFTDVDGQYVAAHTAQQWDLGGSAPLAIKRAHEELENGDREAAANHLDRILK
jgi:hypothetical protein